MKMILKMNIRRTWGHVFWVMLAGILCVGCGMKASAIQGESLMLAGNTSGNLLYMPVTDVQVRSTYRPGGTVYVEGKDYVVNREAGTIARLDGSRIPDFSKNVLFGKKDFDHSQHPGYGNGPFTVYVDYRAPVPGPLAEKVDQSSQLTRTGEKLRAGKTVKLIAYGDSITAGGEASSVELQYPSRYADYLRQRFPKATITFENGATGGDTTREGLARLQAKVLSRSPDLVLVAFGMNDHNNVGSVLVPEFTANLISIVNQIKSKTGADVILLSCFPPNPDWHYGSHHMGDYAAATRKAAEATGAAYADVYGVWEKVLARKDSPSLLNNDINHPNDFGHWLYLQALEAVGF